VWNFKAP